MLDRSCRRWKFKTIAGEKPLALGNSFFCRHPGPLITIRNEDEAMGPAGRPPYKNLGK